MQWQREHRDTVEVPGVTRRSGELQSRVRLHFLTGSNWPTPKMGIPTARSFSNLSKVSNAIRHGASSRAIISQRTWPQQMKLAPRMARRPPAAAALLLERPRRDWTFSPVRWFGAVKDDR